MERIKSQKGMFFVKKLFAILLAFVLMVSIIPLGTACFTISAEVTDVAEKGDANSDGTVNAKDCALLMQYINGWNVQVDIVATDINSDSKLNNKDYVLLMRQINGWDPTVTPPNDDIGIELPMDKWQ